MNPIVMKFLVMFVLVGILTIFFVVMFLFYRKVIRPWKLRLFHYKQVLYTAQVLMQSKSYDDKVESLLEKKIDDLDLIRIAEEEIEKAKELHKKILEGKKSLKVESKEPKESFFEKLKKSWRKEDGKKTVREIARGKDKGEVGTKEEGTKAGGESSTGTGTDSGKGGESSTGEGSGESKAGSSNVAEAYNGDAEHRSVQSESVRVNEGQPRYFS